MWTHSGLMGSRCGEAGGRARSQSSWEKLKTTAFLETGGITGEGGGADAGDSEIKPCDVRVCV